MADYEWTGAASTDFDTNGNWRGGTSPAGSLAGGDNITVLKTAVNDMLLNIDLTDEDTNGFRAGTFYIQPGCAVNVGASGAPLKCSAANLIHRGNGTLYFQASEGTSSLSDTDNVVINSPNLAAAAVIDDDAAQTITSIQVTSGAVTLASDMLTVTYLNVGSVGSSGINPVVTVNSSAAFVTNMIIASGKVNMARPMSYVWLDGGALDFTHSSYGGNLFLSGGVVTWSSVSDIAKAWVCNSGRLDLRPILGPMTITDLWKFPTGTIDKNDQMVTVTNNHTFGLDTD